MGEHYPPEHIEKFVYKSLIKARLESFDPAYYRRFYLVINRIKQILASGEIGKPVCAQINAFENFDPNPNDARFLLLE